ncbi:MAG: hypothetical protein KatS3mg104_3055 [Phycisphaerae bacterium]|nr:MAG: hypothetical protein KatS3mg104_3055 [Phycisphaerae bacterium]
MSFSDLCNIGFDYYKKLLTGTRDSAGAIVSSETLLHNGLKGTLQPIREKRTDLFSRFGVALTHVLYTDRWIEFSPGDKVITEAGTSYLVYGIENMGGRNRYYAIYLEQQL